MNTQQTENLNDLFNQINDRLEIIGETPDAYFMVQLIEILKFEIAKNNNPNSIKTMVDRFLGWKLPADFAPDAGITFKRLANADSPVELQYKHEPVGTNLFTADQAKAMFEHCIGDDLNQDQPEGEPVATIEILPMPAGVTGQRYINWVKECPPVGTKLYTHPPAPKQITADDVTHDMESAFSKQFTNGAGMTNDDVIAAAVNAWIKHRSIK